MNYYKLELIKMNYNVLQWQEIFGWTAINVLLFAEHSKLLTYANISETSVCTIRIAHILTLAYKHHPYVCTPHMSIYTFHTPSNALLTYSYVYCVHCTSQAGACSIVLLIGLLPVRNILHFSTCKACVYIEWYQEITS